jgi:hypothetical protein
MMMMLVDVVVLMMLSDVCRSGRVVGVSGARCLVRVRRRDFKAALKPVATPLRSTIPRAFHLQSFFPASSTVHPITILKSNSVFTLLDGPRPIG